MADAPLLAGIDIGTTGTRCVVFDLTGRRAGAAYATYGVNEPGPGHVEQSVPAILDATHEVCRRAVAESAPSGDVIAVGVSSQMSTTCPVLADGAPLRPLISWEDTRAREQVEWIAQRCSASRFKAITGSPLAAQLVAPTMLWLREHEPETFDRAAAWPQLQGLALHSLGADDFPLDHAEAFAYGLWDVTQRRWSDELLELTDIEPALLGTAVPAGAPVGTVSADAAAQTGFAAETVLCAGAGDQMCGLVGMGAIEPGIAASTLGTGGALLATTDRPRTDIEGMTTVDHAVPERWALFAPTLAAASAFTWFRDQLGTPETEAARRSRASSFELLDALAASSPQGARGVLFLPYLNSAGAPHWNPSASGAFLGLTKETERADLARAVMEGVTHEMLDNVRRLEGTGLGQRTIRAAGGAARSDLWSRIQADMYGLPVERPRESESAALGAAILAGTGAELFSSVEEAVDAMVHVADTFDPDPTSHARYADLHETFDAIYDALDPSVFDSLAAARSDR